MDIRDLAVFADYFVICSGTSDRMLQALATTLRDYVKEEFNDYPRIEGESRAGWMLLDLDDIVIHLFSPDLRNYYKLEQLWDKGKIILSLQ